MAALNVPLREYAARCLDPRQRGFVSGRVPSDNVVAIEAHLEEWAAWHPTPSCAMFLDVEAAFPSLSHAWQRAYFVKVGAPSEVRRCLEMSNRGLRTTVSFGTSRSRTISLRAGVRQGCPASGSLFAILLGLEFWAGASPRRTTSSASTPTTSRSDPGRSRTLSARCRLAPLFSSARLASA